MSDPPGIIDTAAQYWAHTNGGIMEINERQRNQLLEPLNKTRIAKRNVGGRELSYMEAWDVKAHLIRIFGFGGFDANVIESDLMFDEKNGNNYDVAYKVTLTLYIHSLGCSFTEAAVGTAHLPQRGEAHDMAVKTAASDALKRCAINLGDQFGLSLYNNGSLRPVVIATLDKVEALGELPAVEQAAGENAADDLTPEENAAVNAAVAAVQETLGGQPVPDHDAALVALRELATNPNDGERITAVIAWKQANPGIAENITQVQGQDITIGRLVERVTAGEFVKR